MAAIGVADGADMVEATTAAAMATVVVDTAVMAGTVGVLPSVVAVAADSMAVARPVVAADIAN